MHNTNHFSRLPIRLSIQKTKKTVFSAIQIVVLFGIMILLPGHENINPHIGKSHVDFFSTKTKELIRIQSNVLFDTSDFDSTVNLNFLIHQTVGELYASRKFEPLWTINYTTNHSFRFLVDALDCASYYGFPKDYFDYSLLKILKDEVEEISPENEDINKRIELEMQASRSAILFAIYLNKGIVHEIHDSLSLDFVKSLPGLFLQKNDFSEVINTVQPTIPAYKYLLNSMPEFLNVFSEVKTPNYFVNDSILASSLHFAGVIDTNKFDSIFTRESGIKSFQKKHKLTADGHLNDTTTKLLLTDLNYRYYQLCLNIDRLRKLNKSGSNYLFVNIPEFRLHVIEDDSLKDQYNIIVGKTRSQTPTLSSAIEKIVANPFWTVPRSIARNEMLYKIRSDSTYLLRNNYYIIDNHEKRVDARSVDWSETDPLGDQLWIRQKNSEVNALGSVKFLFPNNYNVYIHDTPNKKLFGKRRRAFSHGCVRLQNPDKLAHYLSQKLHTNGNESINMIAAISGKRRKVFELDSSIDIHIQYITSVGDAKGKLRFFEDIYRKDAEAMNELFSIGSKI